MSKPIPTTVTFKHHGEVFEGLVLANKGICWQVELSDGSIVLVQKKHVIAEDTTPPAAQVTPDTDTPEEEDETPPAGSLAEMLQKARTNPPKAKAKAAPVPKTTEPTGDMVSLKALCSEMGIEPRIARRRLRKAVGLIGTGSRWEWKATELEAVRTAIAG